MSFGRSNNYQTLYRSLYMLTLIAAGMMVVSCQQNCDAAVEKTVSCPPPVTCPTEHIQLNQLDNETKNRLKAELAKQIREEMRSEWQSEFEQEYQAELQKRNHLLQQKEETSNKPSPAPNIPPTQKIERDPGGLKILRQAFSTQIQYRQPVDERDSFTISDASVYCFVEIASANEEERNITIRFTHSTGLTQSFSLPVSQSPAWRTWSKLNLTKSMTGNWLCEVFNEDGILLASKPFVIVDE